MPNYVFHTADETVKKIYSSINLSHPDHLSPILIAESLNIELAYLPVNSMRINRNIYLDDRLSTEEQWEQFGHELCHVLWHPDNQLHLTQSFIDMQERQANNFALYACIPTDMLMRMEMPPDRCHAIHRMMETFHVTRPFAERRLDLHIEKMNQLTYQ